MKTKIPHKCDKCGCDLWFMTQTKSKCKAAYVRQNNYIFIKGKYVCITCFHKKNATKVP